VSVFALEGPASLRVDLQMGRVEVLATARADVSVEVTSGEPAAFGGRGSADNVQVTRTGAGTITVKGPHRFNLLGRGESYDVVVEVPERTTDVTLAVKFGSVRLAGTFAAVSADMGYGDIEVDAAARLTLKGGHGHARVAHVAGDAEIGFKSGSLRVGHVDGRLRLAGADGLVALDHLAGPAELATSSGAIEVGTAAAGATVRSAYGAVRIRNAIRGVVRVDGSYGNVEVGVPAGTAVWLDATSQHGVVRTDLAADAGPAAGEDTLELHIRTGYGAIDVHRAHHPA
jgi:hypothetical protein